MVGVPNSKGCALCLKRSVKCDEGLPSCWQCMRGGRKCPGYAREMKFVDEGPKMRRLTKKSRSVRLPADTLMNGSLERQREAGDRVNFFAIEHQESTAVDQPPSAALEREQLLACFVSDMFPLGTSGVQKSFFGSWLWHIPPRLGCSPVFDYAAISLALAYFARASGDQLSFQRAEMSYNMSLKALAAVISDERRQFDSDVLGATMLLGSYEKFFGRGHSWIKHAGGTARLLQARGASRCYESPFDYSLFLACRGSIISEALILKKPCFLEAEDWRKIPSGLIEFPLLPKSPKLHHEFFTHLAVVPGIMSRVNDVERRANSSYTSEINRLMVLSQAQALRKDFRDWYEEYIGSEDGLRKPVLSKVPLTESDGLFDSIYIYYDVPSATMITTYYAYLILVNREINRLVPNTIHPEENLTLAQKICQSIKYCSEAGQCGITTMRIVLPIVILELSGIYLPWAETWLQRISTSTDPSCDNKERQHQYPVTAFG
ncbi:unnamed protein product [Clonostachys chloroleuca]|uniref:Zn(2)-C6 fungal-type domain-containing protein n=1 Tax=Clonostachys chloroleuca TaxID=1926264 RepID=A0AA35MAL2_9HYPO|nr:unnamed protein product [Clonostachys chloroleuca]